jgi:hypothetical protein
MNNVSGGEYWVQVIDFHECAFKLPLNIHEPEPIEVEADLVIPDVGQNSGSIHLNVSGGTGQISYSWNTGATTPDLTNLPIGTYTVTIRDENDCMEVISYNLSPAGMEGPIEIPMALYPNPALDYAWIEFGENAGEQLVIRLHDLSGKMIREVASGSFMAGERLRIDLAGISQGFYFITVRGSNVNSQLKLIKH